MEFGPITVNSLMYTDVIRAPLTETYRLPLAVKEFGSDPLLSELLRVISCPPPGPQSACDNSSLVDSESPIVSHLSHSFSQHSRFPEQN